jgi:hypothetical protein
MRFAGRILDIDQEIADRWGHLSGARRATVPVIDGLLAATAIHHNLTLVTRNTKDIAGTGAVLSIHGQTKAIVCGVGKRRCGACRPRIATITRSSRSPIRNFA